MLISKAQSNLVGGVSQQPDALRLESQCKVQENAYGTIVEGLKKRFPTKWLKALTPSPATLDFSNASYHWINRDTSERYLAAVVTDNAPAVDRVKVWDLDGNAEFVHYPNSTVVNNYLTGASSDYKWTTVNDYTFLTNTAKTVTLGAATTPAQEARKAYIYVRQGNYRANYSTTITFPSAALTAEVNTWDGTTTGSGGRERWLLTITNQGSGQWLMSLMGYTRTWGSGASPAACATAAQNAINQASGAADGLDDLVTATGATGFFPYTTITADYDGISFTPAVFPPTGGTYTLVQQVDGAGTEWNSIKTDSIATQLQNKLVAVAALSGISTFSASVSGSVIEVTDTANDFVAITTKDSIGDTAMKSYFQTVDNFDELPPRCRDGVVFKIQGSVETAEDDFYVKFVAKVPGSFGEGEWRETLGPGIKYTLENMPLVLVRRIDNGSGTITGTPYLPYFSVEAFTWIDRLVGDNDSNPAPTFVDTPITDVFFHKNRLGLLTESSVVMSEAGVYGNFWRTTVRQLLDSDPIDIQAAHTSVAKLKYAVPHNERLLVFADRAQFVVSGDPLLTPKTASIQFVTAYEADMGVSPIPLGKNIYFVSTRGAYSSFWEYQQVMENVTVGAYQATDIATQIPRYIPSGVSDIIGNSTEEVFLLRNPSTPDTLYVWKYFINGNQVLQSAWSKFVFDGFDSIQSLAFFDNVLYMVTKIGSGYALQKMEIKFGTDDFSTITEPLLDCVLDIDEQVAAGAMTVNYVTLPGDQHTEIVLPPDFDYPSTGFTPIVLTAAGESLTLERVSSSSFKYNGHHGHTVAGFFFGHPYTMRYQFGKVDMREDTPNYGRSTVKAGRYQNLFGLLKYAKTNNFTVSTEILQEGPQTMTFTASTGNDGTGVIPLDYGEYRFPTLTKTDNLTVEVTNATPFPCTILGAEWIANFNTNFPRVR